MATLIKYARSTLEVDHVVWVEKETNKLTLQGYQHLKSREMKRSHQKNPIKVGVKTRLEPMNSSRKEF